MPRIYDTDNEPHDFCKTCFPDETDFKNGENNGYDANHPPYQFEKYNCEECGKRLVEEDN